jgi:hypothetical protein
MRKDEFIRAINELVWKWNGPDSLTPRDKLEAIWHKVREQGAHDLAEFQRQKEAEALEKERVIR